MLAGKHILLGVTGGIAAYKTTFLVRLLVRQGCESEGDYDILSKRLC
jgi:phosphopantothenoylcysteine decarboxylase/phosphopantothenate--cysteine ligase